MLNTIFLFNQHIFFDYDLRQFSYWVLFIYLNKLELKKNTYVY